MIRNDYLLRMIQQLSEALARIAGLRVAGQHERALDELGKLYEELGTPREVVDVVDTATLVRLCGHPEKVRALAKVIREEAKIFEALGDPRAAARLRRADELEQSAG